MEYFYFANSLLILEYNILSSRKVINIRLENDKALFQGLWNFANRWDLDLLLNETITKWQNFSKELFALIALN